MKLSIIVALLFLTSGCAVYVEAGAGDHRSIGTCKTTCWDDGNGVGTHVKVRGERRFSQRTKGFCSWAHYSQIDVGRPYNNRAESSLDAFSCGVSIRILGERQ